MQPGPEATIANASANRQSYAATNRNDMFDTSGPAFDSDSGDFVPNSGGGRRSPAARHAGNLNGLGPAGYFNNTKGFHKGVRPGYGRNQNVSVTRSRGFSGGGIGGVGLPGPR